MRWMILPLVTLAALIASIHPLVTAALAAFRTAGAM